MKLCALRTELLQSFVSSLKFLSIIPIVIKIRSIISIIDKLLSLKFHHWNCHQNLYHHSFHFYWNSIVVPEMFLHICPISSIVIKTQSLWLWVKFVWSLQSSMKFLSNISTVILILPFPVISIVIVILHDRAIKRWLKSRSAISNIKGKFSFSPQQFAL